MEVRKIIIGIIISIILFIGTSLFCWIIFPNDGYKWNNLWELLHAIERFIFISCFLFYVRPFIDIKQYFWDVEKNIIIRLIIIYWFYSFGDIFDRLFFNENRFTWNDVLIHIFNLYYFISTYKIYKKLL